MGIAVTGQAEVVRMLRSAGFDAERILSVIGEHGLVCVPRTPTAKKMDSDAVYEAEHEEDALRVWKSMIHAFEEED
jgi:hypothetical protein